MTRFAAFLLLSLAACGGPTTYGECVDSHTLVEHFGNGTTRTTDCSDSRGCQPRPNGAPVCYIDGAPSPTTN